SEVFERSQPTVRMVGLFKDGLDDLRHTVDSMTIAQALAFLYEQPGIANPIAVENRETPEVVILEGTLFGYDQCCIDHFVSTKYLGEPEDTELLASLHRTKAFNDLPDHHTLCYDHAQALIDQG